MGMTENQGGSDLRTNVTRAVTLSGSGDRRAFRISGHKWFMSAPMCDAFLVLAQAERGLSCFLLPRLTADGRTNAIRIHRLKDKLGNRSNASSEVEFYDAAGRTDRRGRPRHPDHHRDEHLYAARLRASARPA